MVLDKVIQLVCSFPIVPLSGLLHGVMVMQLFLPQYITVRLKSRISNFISKLFVVNTGNYYC